MTTQVAWTHDAHFAHRPSSARGARDFVQLRLNEHDLPYLVDDVRLVVSELVSNVWRHARSPARVTLEELLFCVKLTVRNGAADAGPVARFAKPTDVSGRGLAVVAQCSAGWGVESAADGEQAVWALFAVQPPSYTGRAPAPPPS